MHASAVPSLRVLVVEDETDARASLCEMIGLWGHAAAQAEDGPAALRAAPSFHPDLVLMDIGLPGMDGFETTRRLRGLPGLADVPVVAVTAYGAASDCRRSCEAGCAFHMVKPVEPDDLRVIVDWAAARALYARGLADCGGTGGLPSRDNGRPGP